MHPSTTGSSLLDNEKASRRLHMIGAHLMQSNDHQRFSSENIVSSNECAGSAMGLSASSLSMMKMGASIPNKRQKITKWNGWGYKDTDFVMDEKRDVYVTGDRYILSGHYVPDFRPWFENFTGLDTKYPSPPQSWEEMQKKITKPIICKAFVDDIKQANCFKFIAFEDEVRLLHSHGHTCQEIYQLRYGKFKRLVDMVIYPGSHDHVQQIVSIANKYADQLTIIPYGGGTSVSQALMCPENETRMIVSVDMQEMNRVLSVDFESNTAVIEAGAIGIDIQKELKEKYGLTLGHEPDSVEFSSVGGWVATRASGMKKNLYGNIEDMLVNLKIVTPTGTWSLPCNVPRKSTGPDLLHLFLGSEGTLGIITEVTLRVRKCPECQVYGSVLVPDFETGVACLHEVATKRVAPASIRLIDNSQFQFGQSLKPKQESVFEGIGDWFKKIYVTKVAGFDPEKMCVITLLFEGTQEEVDRQQKIIYDITSKYGGLKAGAEAGGRGYLLTYVIAYLRDYGFNYYFMAESFETSVPWSNIVPMINKVRERVVDSAKKHGVISVPWVSARVTQTYETGACVYFYYGFIFRGLKDPIRVFSEIEAEARDEILLQGGSLSHHHGVGKLRKHWMPEVIREQGVDILKSLKQKIDPNNLLGNGNMGLTKADLSVSALIE
ncbi:hypothetical protein FDP41_007611 [Naegleria fowleri]|uniref:Alkylglycerone-phosphate synthase n=1 Tax=Naegleria fowleri TaxID=5763 RepID=A0A6A5C7F7_NAEFO|nr:uncharacterized protein FDP41_007611 [Naegleria fowleri]KAF0983696.1 hypothetical protein FDP41_007611 [Naegleria fowleri]CAG4716626.1 unnamed protein product [Naegleria fowleri]